VAIEDLGDLSLKSKNAIEFNTGCAVFAESEAISRVAEGFAKEDLLAGIHKALASQSYSLAERLGIEKDFALTGGGARNKGLTKAMRDLVEFDVYVPDAPHLTAALGAAILAGEALEGIKVTHVGKNA
jgi:activator of 2-hydroxyglutaryl-CoA dehydratase